MKRLLCALLGHDLRGRHPVYALDATSCWCGHVVHSNALRLLGSGPFVAPFGTRGLIEPEA